MMLILLCDQATKHMSQPQSASSESDSKRSYFMMDLFYTLANYIQGIQKYFYFKTLSLNNFTGLNSIEHILEVFTHKSTFRNFGLFSKLYFKMVANIISAPRLHRFMLQLWSRIYDNHFEQ